MSEGKKNKNTAKNCNRWMMIFFILLFPIRAFVFNLPMFFTSFALIPSITKQNILEVKAFMQIWWRFDSPRTRTWFVWTDLSRWQEIYCRRKLTDCQQPAASTKEITLHNYSNFLHIYYSVAASYERLKVTISSIKLRDNMFVSLLRLSFHWTG